MASVTMAGLSSIVGPMLSEIQKTNQLIDDLTREVQNLSTGTSSPAGPTPSSGGGGIFSALWGGVKTSTKAFLTVAGALVGVERAATGLDRALTKIASDYGGGALSREKAVASNIIETAILGWTEGLGISAVNATRSDMANQGLFMDALDQPFITMAHAAQDFGLEVGKMFDPARQLVASGAGDSIMQTFMQVQKFGIEMGKRGLNAKKAIDSLSQVPDLVVKFGSTSSEQLQRMIEMSTKLGISARKMEDQMMGMSAKGFAGLIEDIAKLQTVMPGVSIDFNELAQAVEFGDATSIQNILQKQFGDVDFTTLSRTTKRAMSDLFGYSIDEIQRMAEGINVAGAVGEITADATDPNKDRNNLIKKSNDWLSKAVGWLAKISSTLSGTLGAISSLLASAILPLAGLWASMKVAGLANAAGALSGAGGAIRGGGSLGQAAAAAGSRGAGLFGRGKAAVKDARRFTRGTSTLAERGAMGASWASRRGMTKGMGGLGRKMGFLGSVIAAPMSAYDEFQRSGDVSRSVMTGAGAGVFGGLGGWGGAIAGAKGGAALGTMFSPGVGTVIGGALGGALGAFGGAWGGNKAGESIGRRVDEWKYGPAVDSRLPSQESPPLESPLSEEYRNSISDSSSETISFEKLTNGQNKQIEATNNVANKIDLLLAQTEDVGIAIRTQKYPTSLRITGAGVDLADWVSRSGYDSATRRG